MQAQFDTLTRQVLAIARNETTCRRPTPDRKETAETRMCASDRAAEIVAMGTTGAAILLSAPDAATPVADAVRQIATPRSPHPIMRRPRADREEKRATDMRHGCRRTEMSTEHPDPGDPNQRRL